MGGTPARAQVRPVEPFRGGSVPFPMPPMGGGGIPGVPGGGGSLSVTPHLSAPTGGSAPVGGSTADSHPSRAAQLRQMRDWLAGQREADLTDIPVMRKQPSP